MDYFLECASFLGFLRVCTYCCKVAIQYAQNPDASYDIQSLDDGSLKTPNSVVTDVGVANSDPCSSLTVVESQARTSTVNVVSTSLAQRSSKGHRLSSIFDEDVKQRLIYCCNSQPELRII
jgi:hypothetical protein